MPEGDEPREQAHLSDGRAVYASAADTFEGARTRLSGKNQITVPVSVVRALNWSPGDEIEIRIEGEGVYMEKKLPRSEALRRLRGSLAEAWPNRESADNYARGERASWDKEWQADPAGPPASGN